MWQHQVTMVTGRLQGAGETQSIVVPLWDQPFVSAVPPIAEEELRCYSGPLFFFCRTFLVGSCKWFLICLTWRSTPHVQKKLFCSRNVHCGIWTLPKDTLVAHFKCKIDIKKLIEQSRPVFLKDAVLKLLTNELRIKDFSYPSVIRRIKQFLQCFFSS